ncbi:hypothetical protein GCM10007028_05340 [Algibacter mikhailovii]|uniref:Carrier domain-containing protein n=2 Tax=Algibacter mikhailovii TaxID=425498 RepID=A0A918QSY0_9FLAO|nr:hypothetical protein GCM10007028_05340 [Algibacter mikhailovii]
MKENILKIIQKLSSEEQKLLALKIKDLSQYGALKTRSENPKKLVAYVNEQEVKDSDGLMVYLKSKIPGYMVPSTIKKIKQFPTLPNGKIDKNKLQAITVKKESKNNRSLIKKQPQSDIEKKLVAIWETVLGFSPISVEDNFFEIGGDSILSIQIVAKARNEGIYLKANQLFDSQTIAELSVFATEDQEFSNTTKPYINIEGQTPLTPIQHWFFESHKNAPHFWNQIIELQNIDSISNKMFEIIAEEIISNHEALRLSFRRANSVWEASVLSVNQIKCFHYFSLNKVESLSVQNSKINTTLLDIQNNSELEKGSLFKIIYFECGNLQQNRVFLVAHHLVVDLVSWNIIFNHIVSAIKNGSKDFIPKINKNKTSTINDWSSYLENTIKTNVIADEFEYWKSQIVDVKEFPVDNFIDSKIYLENSIFTYSSELSSTFTKSLLHDANTAYGTKVEDLLIASLITTLCEWANLSEILLGLERQGRNIESQNLDFSNTVGWFTAFFPIALDYNSSQDLGFHIKAVKEKLRRIPNNGLGFGVLKYLTDNNKSDLNELHPKVVFNYLGNSNSIKNTGDLNFEFVKLTSRDPRSERNYEIEINAQIINNSLVANWSFTKDLYKEETAKTLANTFNKNLEAIINHCKIQDNVTYTPSDFPEADINQDDLDNLLSQF